MALNVVLECAGVVLVLYGLRQVFRDIFHPTKSGSMSDWVGIVYSKLLRHTRFRPSVGPLALVSVIAGWVVLLISGFALIYCGVLRGQFSSSSPVDSSGSIGTILLRSIYISVGSFDTFQTFNFAPKTDWMRLVVSLEGLIGISMITASVSWTLLLYPALARSRWFGRDVSLLLRTEERTGISPVKALGTAELLDLTRQVLEYRIDLVLFPILLNFHSTHESSTVAYVLPEVLRFSSEALSDGRQEMVGPGTKLQLALEDLAETIATRVLNRETKDPAETFRMFRDFER